MKNLKGHFITADLHFGHKLVAGLRGFEDIAEHDAWLVDRLNQDLTEDSTLWILGDFSLSLSALSNADKIVGKKMLIAGNHEQCWHRQSTTRGVQQALGRVNRFSMFSRVYTSGQILRRLIDGREIVFSHLPVIGDHKDEDRFASVRPRVGELPVLAGHVHKSWRTFGRQLNVGVDVNDFRPLKLPSAIEEVLSLEGIGASSQVVLEGPWNEFGLG